MPLLHCPDEVLLLIAKLATHEALTSLMSTCQRMNGLGRPLWRKCISFRNEAENGVVVVKPSIKCILRELLKNPDRGLVVEEITFDHPQTHAKIIWGSAFSKYVGMIKRAETVGGGIDWDSIGGQEDLRRILDNFSFVYESGGLDELATLGKSLSDRATLPGGEELLTYPWGTWHQSLIAGSPIHYVGCLLYFCPNLRAFIPGYYTVHDHPSTIPRYSSLALAMSSLTYVELGLGAPNMSGLYAWNKELAGVFRLPQLSSITLQICNSSGYPAVGSEFQSPTLTTINLTTVDVELETIGQIIACAPNMKSLRLTMFIGIGRWKNGKKVRKLREADSFDAQNGAQTGAQTAAQTHHSNSFVDAAELGRMLCNSNGTESNLEHIRIAPKFYSRCNTEIEIRNGGYWESGLYGHRGNIYHWGTKGNLGSLLSFKHLKSLAIDPVVLFGWDPSTSDYLLDILPLSVEKISWLGNFRTWDAHRWTHTQLRKRVWKEYAMELPESKLHQVDFECVNEYGEACNQVCQYRARNKSFGAEWFHRFAWHGYGILVENYTS